MKKCSRTIVFDWHKQFWDGRMVISDALRPWRPRISDGAKSVQGAISEARRRSVRNIADITELSFGIVHDILTT